jgi:glycolate oxidase
MRYVLALEAVLPDRRDHPHRSKAVKNVVGYDLTQLLVGSEGTLAIITRITLRLLPYPPARADGDRPRSRTSAAPSTA